MSVSIDRTQKIFQLPVKNNFLERDQQNWIDSLEKISDPFDFQFSDVKQSIPDKMMSKVKLDDSLKLSFLKYYGFLATDSGKVALLEEPTGQINFVQQGRLFEKYKIIEVTGEGIILKRGIHKIFISKGPN